MMEEDIASNSEDKRAKLEVEKIYYM